MEDWTEDLTEAPTYRGVCGAEAVPESFEAGEPKQNPWEFIEYLSWTIAGPDDFEFLLRMQTLGRKLRK